MVTNIIELLSVFSILILSLVIHEIAHARVAYYLGDPTAKNMGRFSFNPLKHMSYMSILLPIALFLLHAPLLSFAKPVPYNESKFKNPERDIILVSLAGPFANLILAYLLIRFSHYYCLGFFLKSMIDMNSNPQKKNSRVFCLILRKPMNKRISKKMLL